MLTFHHITYTNQQLKPNRSKSSWFHELIFLNFFIGFSVKTMKKKDGIKIVTGDNPSSHITSIVIENDRDITLSSYVYPSNQWFSHNHWGAACYKPFKVGRFSLNLEEQNLVNTNQVLLKDIFSWLWSKWIINLDNGKQNPKTGIRKYSIAPLDVTPLLTRLKDIAEVGEISWCF